MAALGLALGRAGTSGSAGTAVRDAGFAELVGVTTGGAAVACGVCTEIGVVGEVDVADSEGCSWLDGVSDRGGPSMGVGFALRDALGVEAVAGDDSDAVLVCAWAAMSATASCWLVGSSTPSRPVSNILLRVLDFVVRCGNGSSGFDSQGS